MYFGKKVLPFIIILMLSLFIFGCGEDEIETAKTETHIATAVLEPLLPYGEDIYATYATSGDSIEYRSDMLIQELSQLPSINEGFIYETWIYSDEYERLLPALDEQTQNGFTEGTVINYMDVDNLNIADDYNIYKITLDYPSFANLDSVELFSVKIRQDLFDILGKPDANTDVYNNAQDMRKFSDEAVANTDSIIKVEDNINEIKAIADDIKDELLDIKGEVEDIAEANTEIMQLPNIALTPFQDSALDLEEAANNTYAYVDEAVVLADSIQNLDVIDEAKTLANQLQQKTELIAGENGLTIEVFNKLHELVRFYPSFFVEAPEAQALIEGYQIKLTVSQLNRLPEGWVYKIWLKKASEDKAVTTFNTDVLGSAISITKLDKYPSEYEEIYITIEVIEVDDEGNPTDVTIPTGITVLNGFIDKK